MTRRGLVLALCFALPLTACGRKGPPSRPAGEAGDPPFPGFYPYKGSTLPKEEEGEANSETIFGQQRLSSDPYETTTTYGVEP